MQLKLSESMLRKLSDALGFTVTDVYEQDGDLHINGENRYAEGAFSIDFVERKMTITVYYVDNDYLEEEMEVLLDF